MTVERILRRLGVTLAWRTCEACGRGGGCAVWPWSGRLVVTTHGICDACLHERKTVRLAGEGWR